ncbi:P-loop containing nucleoside triphosphate hydrolase protein [Laetiporus sulphureus 93-53]|uniref:p-loop containing nucleoside triphosphate hydrolase protein n=1 Tax=Laetiporus sulphureus 93-53 TaxID=1314785 RepID=A0A165BRC8_9APHY|nr:P-loop containing nucleoside triphosphate hydrolase protein [Laetiporus sulphureus 93-53]KZT01511.1 P-loop containing nucleoside triphosphate hydrolase protein [Laetiporus sulphureus 93-53]
MSSRSKPQSSTQDRKLVMVMGPTGSGKTTFINLVSGSMLRVGSTLESCTKEIQLANLDLGCQPVTLIDTPGFDDTVRPQAEVLKEIAKFLEITYNRKLTGVIYMHRISDNRMSGSAIENVSLFRKICGERPMKNAVIMTNMWSKVDENTGIDREIELRRKYFKSALERGATMIRNDDTVKCARAILGFLMLNQPEELHLQYQQVIEHKPVQETDAGLEFLRRLQELMDDALRRSQTERAKENPDNEEITRLQETVDMLRREESNIQKEIASELSARIQELSQQVLDFIDNSGRVHSGPSDSNSQQSSDAHLQQPPPSPRSSFPTPPRSGSSTSSEADPPSAQQLHPEPVLDSPSVPHSDPSSEPALSSTPFPPPSSDSPHPPPSSSLPTPSADNNDIPHPDSPVSVRSYHFLIQQQPDSSSKPHSDPSSEPALSSKPFPTPSSNSPHPSPSSPLPTSAADKSLPPVSSPPPPTSAAASSSPHSSRSDTPEGTSGNMGNAGGFVVDGDVGGCSTTERVDCKGPGSRMGGGGKGGRTRKIPSGTIDNVDVDSGAASSAHSTPPAAGNSNKKKCWCRRWCCIQ